MWAYLRRFICVFIGCVVFILFICYLVRLPIYRIADLLRLIRDRVVFVNVYALGVCTSASGLWHFFRLQTFSNLHEEIKIMGWDRFCSYVCSSIFLLEFPCFDLARAYGENSQLSISRCILGSPAPDAILEVPSCATGPLTSYGHM